MDEMRPGYYAVIPADVRYDDQIPANAKLLYGEISALIGKDGFCFATNQYFSDLYQVREETVARLITKLEKAGYIVRELERDSTGQVICRKLYLNVSASEEQPLDKKINTPCEKNQEGIDNKVKDTNLNITDIYKENKQRKSGKKRKASTQEETPFEPMALVKDWIGSLDAGRDEKNALYFAIQRLVEVREANKKPWKSKAGVTSLTNRLMRLTKGNIQQMIDLLDTASDCGWLTVYPPKGQAPPLPRILTTMGGMAHGCKQSGLAGCPVQCPGFRSDR